MKSARVGNAGKEFIGRVVAPMVAWVVDQLVLFDHWLIAGTFGMRGSIGASSSGAGVTAAFCVENASFCVALPSGVMAGAPKDGSGDKLGDGVGNVSLSVVMPSCESSQFFLSGVGCVWRNGDKVSAFVDSGNHSLADLADFGNHSLNEMRVARGTCGTSISDGFPSCEVTASSS